MTQETWTAVDTYFEQLIPSDPVLDAALAASDAAGLPKINVTPNQGKLLYLLALAIGARRVLEIGTLGGYSTIWLARALPADGTLITLEYEPTHAAVARANLDNADLPVSVDIRQGRALESLAHIAAESQEPFDLIFIDADKQSAKEYFDWAMKLSRRGGMIISDNVVRNGHVIDPATPDTSAQGIRRLTEAMAAEPRIEATAIQTVGSKGYDGFAIAIVRS